MTEAAKPVVWTAADAARATASDASGAWSATGVSIDTRTLAPGDLFIAIEGPNNDGHGFAADAAAAGAAALMVARDRLDEIAAAAPGTPTLAVDDTMVGLEDLGAAARARTSARIVGVTGSVGKTSTKEALRVAVSAGAKVTATQGNLNNHWGLPLSLARMPADTDYGVFEMGMSHPGEISPLSRMSRPHVAAITDVVEVHAEFFESHEAIADAKAEIFDGMDAAGTAVLNRDNPLFDRLGDHARDRGVGRIVGFGATPAADVSLRSCQLFGDASEVVADVFGRPVAYRLGLPGRHQVINSLAVLAVVDALGIDVAAAAARLDKVRPVKGRGDQRVVALAGGGFTLIDESYNASPASMKAAIEVLAAAATQAGGRRIAVLGDMLELGDRSETLHRELVDSLVAAKIDFVFTAGQYMSALWEALPPAMRGGHASTSAKLAPLVTAAVRPGDAVMVKASQGSRMAIVVRVLADLDMPAGDVPKAANGE